MRPTNPRLWCLALIATCAAYSPAFAYLDPGTGSILLQALLGGVAGGLVIVKLYWSRVKEIFGRGSHETPASDGAAQADNDSRPA